VLKFSLPPTSGLLGPSHKGPPRASYKWSRRPITAALTRGASGGLSMTATNIKGTIVTVTHSERLQHQVLEWVRLIVLHGCLRSFVVMSLSTRCASRPCATSPSATL
jgi:hypothetical protein